MPLTRVLGRHPRAAGAILGYGLGFAVMLVFCVVSVRLRVDQVRAGHARVHERMQAVMADTSKLLDELNADFSPSCDEANLKRLRSLMFGHRYARHVGVIDPQGRLFCTTGLGPLDNPAPLGQKRIDGSIGRYYLSTPVERYVGPGQGHLTATVIERGRFQVLVDSSFTTDAFEEYADAVWAGAGAQRRRVFLGKLGDSTDAPVEPDAAPLRIDWRHARLLITTTVPGVSPISVQSVLNARLVDAGRQAVLSLMLAFCALLGYLASNVIGRRCRHFRSMDYRIRHLCTPANLVCHYQPILELATGRMVGCEVLARLLDGDTLVYPDKFIPALNRKKLTWTFDAAVSGAALRELGATLPPQTRFTVALNFFPHNLKRDTIHAHLEAVMRDVAREDLRIELEVTEYDFSPDLAPELRRLKADGYGISIDDFGTGYSNLGMVKKVAPDYLKIDRSFVAEMEDATMRSSLIPEIIAIATAVGSEVIAEGIETAAQEARLRALGVQYGQGYYFARPMGVKALQRYIQNHAGRPPAPS